MVEQVAQAAVHLHKLGVEILMEKSMLEYMASTKCGELASCVPFKELGVTQGGIDLVITFGGDGLLLHFNSLFGGRCLPPVMCFDFGSLGFLTPFVFDNFAKDVSDIFQAFCEVLLRTVSLIFTNIVQVEAVLNEEIMLTLRMRLDCTTYRNNTRCGKPHVHLAHYSPFLLTLRYLGIQLYLYRHLHGAERGCRGPRALALPGSAGPGL